MPKKNIAIVDINDSTETSIFLVDITTKVICFADLTDLDVKNEHDLTCRTVAGLLSEMKRIYFGFDDREIVTLVEFEVNQLDE